MNIDFSFMENDEKGIATLENISEANNFNRWMYVTIKKHCKGRILEIGSGIGNISRFFIEDGSSIHLSDIRQEYINKLKRKFQGSSNLLGVSNIDLVAPDFETRYREYLNSFDTLFSLNVIEHIKDDKLAISNCKKLLKKAGSLIVLVPAYKTLYNQFDKELFHYRRYTKKTLHKLIEQEKELEKISSRYFNSFGTLGWFVSGNILKKKIVPKGQMKLYDRFIPIFKGFDNLFLRQFGLSVIMVAKKI